jgi:hypothetical protein
MRRRGENEMKKTITITLAVVLLAVSTAAAQSKRAKPAPKPSGPAPLEVSVSQVNDRRTNGYFSQLTVSFDLSGIPAAEVSAARVVVKKAADDLGNDLLDPERGEARFESTGQSYLPEDDTTTPANLTIVLTNPSRDATTIQSIEGEIELYMPKRDPAAVAVIPKFQSLAGKPIVSRELKAAGVDIAVIGPAQLEAEKKRLSKVKADEARKEGADPDTVAWIVSSFEEYFFQPSEDEVVLKITDPKSAVHEIVFVDSSGETVRAYTSDQEGLSVLSTYGTPPGEDWSLKVSLRTAKTMARHTFSLTDVGLP